MDYSSLLTDDQKRSILEQRLAQFSSEAYQHSLNAQVAAATNNQEGVDAANEALAVLDTAITVHQEELAKLPAEAPVA
jgi:hypothetical protein